MFFSLPNLKSIDHSRSLNPLARLQTWKMNWLNDSGFDPHKTLFIDPQPHVWTAMRYSAMTPVNLIPRMSQLEFSQRVGALDSIFLIEILPEGNDGRSGSHAWASKYLSLNPEVVAEYTLNGQSIARIRRVDKVNIKKEQLINVSDGSVDSALWHLP